MNNSINEKNNKIPKIRKLKQINEIINKVNNDILTERKVNKYLNTNNSKKINKNNNYYNINNTEQNNKEKILTKIINLEKNDSLKEKNQQSHKYSNSIEVTNNDKKIIPKISLTLKKDININQFLNEPQLMPSERNKVLNFHKEIKKNYFIKVLIYQNHL